ncbi:MAG: hypothetical protein Q9187_009439, partial [Circinaria calcarea]
VDEELSPLVYGIPVFYLYAPHHAYQWVASLGARNSGLIRKLILRGSFLSMDADGPGRLLAVETWAIVLHAMPNLRQLTFDHESDGPNWSDLAYRHPGHNEYSFSLSGAIQDLTKLESLSYLGGRYCNLELLKSKPELRSFRITQATLITKGPMGDYQKELRFLKILELGNMFAYEGWRTEWNWQPLVPATYHWLPDMYYCKAQALLLMEILEGTSRLSVAVRHDLGTLTRSTMAAGVNHLNWLLSNVPNLTYLGLEYGADSSSIAVIPESVQYLALAISGSENASRMAHQLGNLKVRCKNLRSLGVMITHYDKGFNGFTADQGNPLNQALQSLRKAGVDVQVVIRKRRGAMEEYDTDHIDQSGLIP